MLTGHDARRRPRAAAPAEMAEEPRPAFTLRGAARGPVLARTALAQSPAADQVGRRPGAPAPGRPAGHREDAPRERRPLALGSARAHVLPDEPRGLATRRALRTDRRTRARTAAREDEGAEVRERDLDRDGRQARTAAKTR